MLLESEYVGLMVMVIQGGGDINLPSHYNVVGSGCIIKYSNSYIMVGFMLVMIILSYSCVLIQLVSL